MQEEPLVTIGIPVYNGADYITEALDSVVKQTHQNLEVIVCDNCSSDGTPDIVRSFALEDDRIRLIENEHNLGAAGNFNRCLELAAGDYFSWLSADDLIEPTYIEAAMRTLLGRPEVVAAYSHAIRINERSETIGDYRDAMSRLRLDHPSPRIRFNDAVLGFPAIVLFGVMRRTVMLDTPGHGSLIGGDRVFISEMALKGQIARTDEDLFRRRVHPDSYSSMLDKKARASWFSGQEDDHSGGFFPRLAEHHKVLQRAAPDKRTYGAGVFTLIFRLPIVLARTQAFTMVQKLLRLRGRRIDPGRYAS